MTSVRPALPVPPIGASCASIGPRPSPPDDDACAPPAARGRRRRVVSVLLPVVAVGALAALMLHKRDVFVAALHSAPVWLLVLAVALQLLALLVRAEAW